ncbi:tyrosine-type recombinase/integrase [Nonomuraea angiospora]|uniref:tyrosine-type recombinase/integrase n=1 Tax=Nonomuraea angiospora TaxID=46172 RepID=UPI00331D4824
MSPASGADLALSTTGGDRLATMHSFGVPVPTAVDQPSEGADGQEPDLPFAELIPPDALPIRLPDRGSPPPARDPQSLATLLRTAGADKDVLRATGAWLLADRRSATNTQEAYIKDASWWLWWVQARGLELTDVDFIEADTFAAAMRHAGYAAETRRRRLSALKSWYRYLRRARLVRNDPFDGMDLPKRQRDKSTRFVTEAELNQMLTHAVAVESPRVQAILAVLKGTACRVSELTGAQRADLGHRGEHRILTLPAKGGRRHEVVIADLTGDLLDRYLATRDDLSGPLFVTSTGAPLQRTYVTQLVQRIAKAVGVDKPEEVTVHGVRHSVATALLEAGEPIDVVQALLGHADPRTTQTYAHPDHLARSPAHRADHRLAIALGREPR